MKKAFLLLAVGAVAGVLGSDKIKAVARKYEGSELKVVRNEGGIPQTSHINLTGPTNEQE